MGLTIAEQSGRNGCCTVLMNILDINRTTVPVLKPSDTVGFALELMLDEHLFVLPLIDSDGRYAGLLSYEQLSDLGKKDLLKKVNPQYHDRFLTADNSVYDALRVYQSGLGLVVIADAEGQYLDAITADALLGYFAQLGGVDQPGGYITLRIDRNNYALSEIARIAESNNALIVSLLLSSASNADALDITIKFNLEDLTYLIATFERFSYEVIGYHHQSNISDMYNDRYWSLIRYLNT